MRTLRHMFSTTIRLLLVCFVFLAVNPPHNAFALDIPDATCTQETDNQFELPNDLLNDPSKALISSIVMDLQAIVSQMSVNFLLAIYFSDFGDILSVVLVLYVMIYGIFFMFRMLQLTVYDFIARLIKVGIVAGLIGSIFWWIQLYFIVSGAFQDSVDSVIGTVTAITVGASESFDPNYPFAILDRVAGRLTSAEMAVTLIATLFSGPYGLIFGGLMFFAAGSFVRSLFTAMWVYLMALVLRGLLIALMPLFLSFLLFDKTRHLFNGWLNQLVNTCLQPILMFTFFAFFVTLILGTIDHLLATPVCWTKVPDAIRGSSTETYIWRFAVQDDGGNWKPFEGIYSWLGPEDPDNTTGLPVKPFPIDIMHILMFLMLAELSARFNNIIVQIATDLAGASTNFAAMQGPLSNWFSADKGSDTSLPANVGKRATPGGVGYAGPDSAKALEEVKSGLKTQGSSGYIQAMQDTIGKR